LQTVFRVKTRLSRATDINDADFLLFGPKYSPDFASRVNGLMAELGLSQSDVARAIDVTPPCIANWRRGKTRPSMGNLVKLATFLRASRAFLERGEDTSQNHQRLARKKYRLPDNRSYRLK
jgi:transcriptional regulator with XRE-family HTH domain